MQKISAKITVFFENPFWVGIYERLNNNKYSACKIFFGSSEPKDYEVYLFLLENHKDFIFSIAVQSEGFVEKTVNPKRMQREISKLLSSKGTSTKSQNAIKLQQETNKKNRKKQKSKEKEINEIKKFEMRKKKRKDKHKGR